MKIVLPALLSLLVFQLAHANGPAPATVPPGAEVKADAPAAQAAPAPAVKKPRARLHKHYPGGDLRHCLAQKSSQAVIRCAERQRK